MRFYEILCEADVPPDVLRDQKTGRPKLFYHGTTDAFTQFDPRKVHDKEGTRVQIWKTAPMISFKLLAGAAETATRSPENWYDGILSCQ